MTTPAAFQTKALTRRFDDHTVVDRLDLRIPGGAIFGLLGPNGAGKSTTIKMLTTLLPPSSGTASVAGHDVVTEAAKVRGAINYVPQLLSADGTLDSSGNVRFQTRRKVIWPFWLPWVARLVEPDRRRVEWRRAVKAALAWAEG